MKTKDILGLPIKFKYKLRLITSKEITPTKVNKIPLLKPIKNDEVSDKLQRGRD